MARSPQFAIRGNRFTPNDDKGGSGRLVELAREAHVAQSGDSRLQAADDYQLEMHTLLEFLRWLVGLSGPPPRQ